MTTKTERQRVTAATEAFVNGYANRAWLVPGYEEHATIGHAAALVVIAPALGIDPDEIDAHLQWFGKPPRPLDQRARWVSDTTIRLLNQAGLVPYWAATV